MKKSALSEQSLKALWCVLDADDSNALQADEFRKFLRLGEGEKKKATLFGGQVCAPACPCDLNMLPVPCTLCPCLSV